MGRNGSPTVARSCMLYPEGRSYHAFPSIPCPRTVQACIGRFISLGLISKTKVRSTYLLSKTNYSAHLKYCNADSGTRLILTSIPHLSARTSSVESSIELSQGSTSARIHVDWSSLIIRSTGFVPNGKRRRSRKRPYSS